MDWLYFIYYTTVIGKSNKNNRARYALQVVVWNFFFSIACFLIIAKEIEIISKTITIIIAGLFACIPMIITANYYKDRERYNLIISEKRHLGEKYKGIFRIIGIFVFLMSYTLIILGFVLGSKMN
jgi:hypothetical protein